MFFLKNFYKLAIGLFCVILLSGCNHGADNYVCTINFNDIENTETYEDGCSELPENVNFNFQDIDNLAEGEEVTFVAYSNEEGKGIKVVLKKGEFDFSLLGKSKLQTLDAQTQNHCLKYHGHGETEAHIQYFNEDCASAGDMVSQIETDKTPGSFNHRELMYKASGITKGKKLRGTLTIAAPSTSHHDHDH